jgi:hypothetical protein
LLAYVFWHVPRANAAAREYELRHREFHTVLLAANVAGLRSVRVFRLNSIPWLGGKAGYEDWHLLDDSAGLDVLDHAAVTQARQIPHDRIAALAGEGTAGLYGLRKGNPIEPVIAYWMSKPEGMSYATFEASLAPHVAAGCCLWGRRMTLGPTPEFCLHAPGKRQMPHPSVAIATQALGKETDS